MANKKLTITINEEFTVSNVEQWYQTNKDKIINHSVIGIKLKNLTQIDVAGLQVLQSIKNIPDKRVTISAEVDEIMGALLKRCAVTNILN